MPRRSPFHDPALGEITDDQLTADVRVYQRARGHRFSSDDMATAYFAWKNAPDARRVLDLGCGLGSVLLTLAWKLPDATLAGIEAQSVSFALLARNVARNGLADRVSIHHGDLRDAHAMASLGDAFDLVTGTPPYFPESATVSALDSQRAHARVELRGGVEDYIATGATKLAAHGTMVLCGDARSDARVARASTDAGLSVVQTVEIIPRTGRPALFGVWTLSRNRSIPNRLALTLRDEQGRTTPDADALRTFAGFPSRLVER